MRILLFILLTLTTAAQAAISDRVFVRNPDGSFREVRWQASDYGPAQATGTGGVTVSGTKTVPSAAGGIPVQTVRNVGKTALAAAGTLLTRANPAIAFGLLALEAYHIYQSSTGIDYRDVAPPVSSSGYECNGKYYGRPDQWVDCPGLITDIITQGGQYTIYSISSWSCASWGEVDGYQQNDTGALFPLPSHIYCRTAPVSQSCPSGYTMQNGQCVGNQHPATDQEIQDAISQALTDNPNKAPDLYQSILDHWFDVPADSIQTSGPTTIDGPTTSKTYYQPDGTPVTETTQTTYNITYQGDTVTVTKNITTTTVNNTTGQVIDQTTTTEAPPTTNVPEPVPQEPQKVELPPFCDWAPAELCDWAFNADQPQYDDQVDTPQKSDIQPVIDNAKTTIQGFSSNVGITAAAGECNIPIPVSVGSASGSGQIDFCQFSGPVTTMGNIVVGLAYLYAGMIVLGIRR